MTFLHPWALYAGAAAAALPVIVHWLTRPRPVRMPLSTIRFVREVVRQRRARHRLRDLLVLLLRTAAVLLVALALARPQWGSQTQVSEEQEGDTVRVVILDVSQSMGAIDQRVEILERARTAAASYLRYRPGLRVNLILAAAAPRAVFDQPSTNFEALRDELAAARVLPQRLDVRRALEAAARMLTPCGEDDARRRELVMVSDFQQSNWPSSKEGPDLAVLPVDTRIELVSAAAARTLGNLALTRADCQGRGTVGRTVRLEVDVENDSPAPRDVTVDVTLGDASFRLSGRAANGRKTTLSEEIPLRAAGWQWGAARLVGNEDALAADDVCPIVMQTRPKPLYALITRQPATQRPSSSLFIECALVPDAQLHERASSRIVRIRPETLDRESLAPADLIVLDHPGKLDDAGIRLLAGLLRRGRPILYVTAEPVDASNLKMLIDNAGRGLQLPLEFAPSPAGQTRHDLFWTNYRRDDSILHIFGDQIDSVVGGLRFGGGLVTRRRDVGLASDVVATYNDGSAGIVVSSSDAGTLAILNADLAASNLPASNSFVPLMEELAQRLMVRGHSARAVCGEPLVVQLPADVGVAAGLTVVGPESKANSVSAPEQCGQLSDDGAGVVWHWPSPTRPGVYRVCRGTQIEFALAVQLPEDESDLATYQADVLTNKLAGDRTVHVQAAGSDDEQQDRDWAWLAVACVACIIGEVVTLILFRS